jgi:cystathionine beta-synthase (O-acetyl-L-serine)
MKKGICSKHYNYVRSLAIPGGAMNVVGNIVELIGNTPLLSLEAVREKGEAEIWAKLEYLNPGMSVKDRIALCMIREAEKNGSLGKGGTIIEATAGNTGVGLALVGAALGYRVIIVMVEGYAREKMTLVKGLGGEIILVPKEKGMAGAVEKAKELEKQIAGACWTRQFENEANPRAHYETTGPEIWKQLEGKVDGIAVGAGTGGSFTGIARFLKEKNPALKAYVVEPPDSILGGGEGRGEHMVEGIGNHWWPLTLDKTLVDGVFTLPNKEIYRMVDKLGRLGLPVGSSSGANVVGAKKLAKMLGEGKKVATLLTDPAERYFSKYVFDGKYEGREIV